MSLLTPMLFALGAAALAVPLWVHLRLGKVKKRAVVGSLRLLRASPQSSRTPRRLVRRLLLLLRCLIVLLIALGFARLLLPWLGQGAVVESTALVLDVSGSMQAKNGLRTSWDIAREAALAHLNRLAPSARVALILSPFHNTRPEWTDPATARGVIRKLKPGFAANQLHADILAAVSALQVMPDDQPKTLHLISDFQRSSLSGIDQIAIPQGIQIQLTKTSPEKPANRGIVVMVGQAGAANLRLYGFNDATPGTLALSENGATNTSAISAGRLLATTPPVPREDGTVLRHLKINEADDLAADDAACDVFQPQKEIAVWLWEPAQQAAKAKSEMEKPTYFLSRALQPSELVSDSVSLFRPRAVTESDLAGTNLPSLLIVPAADRYPESLAALATAVTAQGGSAIFFGGKTLSAPALGVFGQLPPVVPNAVEDVPVKPALATIGYDHPLFGVLGAEARLRLAASPLLQRHALTVNPSARVLARFADGKPFIVEGDAGAGRVYFVNTSADREFGDWPADAPRFIPAVHLLAARAIEKIYHRPEDAPFLAGEPRTLRLDPTLAGKTVVIAGTKYAVEMDGTVPGVVFAGPGVNTVLLNDQPVHTVAVNFPPAESALDNLSETVIRQRLESQRQQGGGSSVRWENINAGQLAWQLCLLFGSLLLLIEPLIADRKSTR